MKTLFLLFTLIFTAQSFAAPQLTPAGRLRKLSRQIRGIDPIPSEYEQLKDALQKKDASGLEFFFDSKAKEYFQHQNHISKMVNRLTDLYRLQPTEYTSATPTYGAMDNLFAETASKNLSWDNLLTSKNYSFQVYNDGNGGSNSQRGSDRAFFKPLFPELLATTTRKTVVFYDPTVQNNYPYVPPPVLTIKGEGNDLRLAGALTTARFTNRYTTTNVNKNRRRAAAVLRVALCRDLKPAIFQAPDQNGSLLKRAFPNNGTKKPTTAAALEKKHGTLKDCMGCHSVLDPMGKTFQSMGAALGDEPSPGAFVFTDDNGQSVNIPVQGIGELAKTITEQPQYAECQVKHFWRWFIGTDVELTPNRLNELVQNFNKMGRKTNDFISYLVSQPEFYTKRDTHQNQSTSSKGFDIVKPLFNKCMSCHTGGYPPDLLPADVPPDQMKAYIADIVRMTDLQHDGMNAQMPPKSAGWKISQDEMDALKAWIQGGAPNSNGQMQLDQKAINEVFNK